MSSVRHDQGHVAVDQRREPEAPVLHPSRKDEYPRKRIGRLMREERAALRTAAEILERLTDGAG